MSTSSRRRREVILNEIYVAGHVTVRALAGHLGVSQATVRRDLRALAARDEVQLVYGGASLVRNIDYSFRSKATRNIEAKRTIGRLAAGLVRDGEQIFVDSGTTSFEMAPYLKMLRGISVIVNSARLAMELDTAGLNVIILGGQYRPERMDTIGPLATSTLEQLRGYTAFIGADGLSRDFGLTASDIESAHLYRLAIRNARETVLLVDSSKFLKPSLFKIVDFDAVSRVVTEKSPAAEWADFLAARSVELVLPDEDSLMDDTRKAGSA
ncbi:MAG: DeoR/GlpR transcriptional regulator [Planctomycetes bacterium]|nr:DeoR/GlpR transcriptional regulator [Planctomycetota bacterium]